MSVVPSRVALPVDMAGLLPLLETFATGDVDLLKARGLLTRIDRKYLLPIRLLPDLLERLRGGYRLLPAGERAAASYRTLYFDTAERALFHDHRRGRYPRTKVRIRHHVDRQVSFLEVKRKQHGGRTAKKRAELAFGQERLAPASLAFIDEHCEYPAAGLTPAVTNEFTRLTLLGDQVNERLTIDWGLLVGDGRRTVGFPAVAIVEVKQSRHSDAGPAARALRQLRVREGAISKYCLAVIRLGAARQNPFKPALRALELLST